MIWFILCLQMSWATLVPELPQIFHQYTPRMSEIEYVRYVRPQLKSIVREFYQILEQSAPIYKKVLNLKKDLDTQLLAAQEWNQRCPQAQDCFDQLSTLTLQAQRIERDLANLKNDWIKLVSPDSVMFSPLVGQESNVQNQDLYLRPMMGAQALNQFGLHFSAYLNHLEIIQSIYWQGKSMVERQKITMGQSLPQLQTEFEIWFLDLLPEGLRDEFYAYWKFFVDKIEKDILEAKRGKGLLGHLEDFNNQNHIFHMRLQKSELSPTSSIKNLSTVMQRRWNSVLKVVLN